MECWVLGVVLQGTLKAATDAACDIAAIPWAISVISLKLLFV